MEDAVQALKMAFAVFVFVIAISVAFYVISKAKATSETIFYVSDKTNYYDNVESNSNVTRTVGLETVIPTLYRYYRENFMVQIMDASGNVLQVFDTTTEWEVSNAAKVIVQKRNDRQKTLMELYGKGTTNMFGAPSASHFIHLVISIGFPIFSNGVSYLNLFIDSSSIFLFISVFIIPGAILFTLILDGPNSFANALVNPFIPALLVEYATSQDAPVCPHIDEIFIISPEP